MALGFQARAMQRVLSKLGVDALLAGAPARVNLQRGVQVFAGIGDTAEDNPTVRADVATIDKALGPKVGQRLEHPDGNFVLDRLLADNGLLVRFTVVAVP